MFGLEPLLQGLDEGGYHVMVEWSRRGDLAERLADDVSMVRRGGRRARRGRCRQRSRVGRHCLLATERAALRVRRVEKAEPLGHE